MVLFTLSSRGGDPAFFTSTSAAVHAWLAPTSAPSGTSTATPRAFSTEASAEITAIRATDSTTEAPGSTQQQSSRDGHNILELSNGAIVIGALAVAVVLSLFVAVAMHVRRKERSRGQAVVGLGLSPARGTSCAGGSQSSFGVIRPAASEKWLPPGGNGTYAGIGIGMPPSTNGMGDVGGAYPDAVSLSFWEPRNVGQAVGCQAVVSLEPTAMFTNRLQPHASPSGVRHARPGNRWASGLPSSLI